MKFLSAIIIGFFLFLILVVPAEAFRWPAQGAITSYNGWNSNSFGNYYHAGIDIGAFEGDPIVASSRGCITYSGWDNTGYGNRVDITNGDDVFLYGHLSYIHVWSGCVAEGQYIGNVGSTGNSYGPHLHLEIWWRGQAVDPIVVLP